jgi:hypothetical protein
MKRAVEAITMAAPELRDDVYLFPQGRDVPAVIGKNNVGWRYVDLRHLAAPPKLRHAAILADGRVLLPALLCFKTERGAIKAIEEFQRPMAAEHYRETFLVEVAILRSRVVRDSTAAKLIDEMAAIVKATAEARVSAACVLS